MNTRLAKELRANIIEPVLWQIGLGGKDAVSLLLGTAVAESGLQAFRQVNGPALGLWQMEPSTHEDIWTNYLDYREDLVSQIYAAANIAVADAEVLVFNLRYACVMARVHYKRNPETIPSTLEGQARYLSLIHI